MKAKLAPPVRGKDRKIEKTLKSNSVNGNKRKGKKNVKGHSNNPKQLVQDAYRNQSIANTPVNGTTTLGSNRVHVIEYSAADRPSCPHGPCLLFARHKTGKNNKEASVEHFFACAVCRSRKLCSVYIPVQMQQAEGSIAPTALFKTPKQEHQAREDTCSNMPDSLRAHCKIFDRFQKLVRGEQDVRYCHTCEKLVARAEQKSHVGHTVTGCLTKRQLRHPTTVFNANTCAEKEGQYWFSGPSMDLVLGEIGRQQYDSVLCVACPRLFEQTRARCRDTNMYLLDIDHRLCQFVSARQFSPYSLYANHFYVAKSQALLAKFMLKTQRKMLIVCDPPFGGLVAPLIGALRSLQQLALVKQEANQDDQDTIPIQVDVLLFLPYFHGREIQELWPELNMLDYVVTYDNHNSFGNNSSKAAKSPVRMFTTIHPAQFVLPEVMGYRLCSPCNRYVADTNVHCMECNACTSKDGRAMRHCVECVRCVKASYLHCPVCVVCHLPGKCRTTIKEPETEAHVGGPTTKRNTGGPTKKKRKKM